MQEVGVKQAPPVGGRPLFLGICMHLSGTVCVLGYEPRSIDHFR